MPTYEYECTKCGTIIEVFQSITQQPKRRLDCETCGDRTPVRRLLGTGGAIVFKGNGFYATDYRSDSYKKAAKADKPAGQDKSDSGQSSESAPTKADKSEAKKSGED